MKYILFTSSLWLLWSCSLTQKSLQTLKYPISQDSNTPLENSVALIGDELMSNPSATLIIDSTRLEENYLWIQYHDFSADGSLNGREPGYCKIISSYSNLQNHPQTK